MKLLGYVNAANYWHHEAMLAPGSYEDYGVRAGIPLAMIWATWPVEHWEAMRQLRLLDFSERQAWEYIRLACISTSGPVDDDGPVEETAVTAALNAQREAYIPIGGPAPKDKK